MREEEKVSYDDNCKETADIPREWYEKEVERLYIENDKLKKLVDILLEREMRSNYEN